MNDINFFFTKILVDQNTVQRVVLPTHNTTNRRLFYVHVGRQVKYIVKISFIYLAIGILSGQM